MTNPNHDPMMKKTIRDRLYALLYVPADTRMFERIKAIIVKNAGYVNAAHASFMYKAVNYTCDASPILPRPRNQLDPRMESEMREYLQDEKDLADEKPLVLAYLTQVLNASDHPGDWIRLLIPALHRPVQELLAERTFQDKRMDDQAVEEFLAKNKGAVSRIKQRLVTNLITI